MSQPTICNVCHLMPRTVSVTAGYRVRCVHGECCWGPVRPSEAEAVAAWNEMMRPARPSVTWTTEPNEAEIFGVIARDVDGDLLDAPIASGAFGQLEGTVLGGRCTVTLTAVRTEAEPEPPKWTAPPWCKDNGDGGYAILAKRCATDGKASRDDCDGCAYYVAEDDASPVPSDVARLYQKYVTLAAALNELRKSINLTSASTAEYRKRTNDRLNKLESPETVEFAAIVEPDEPKTRTVILRHRNGCECGNHKIETGYAPDGFVLDGVTYAIDPTRPNTYRATYLPPAHHGEVLIRKGLDGD